MRRVMLTFPIVNDVHGQSLTRRRLDDLAEPALGQSRSIMAVSRP
jgi:hypothetical protein